MIHPSLDISKEAVKRLCNQYHIERMYIFGSAVREDFTLESDVDVLIDYQKDCVLGLYALVHLKSSLEKLFGREVDVVSSSGLKNAVIKSRIETERELIYEG